jgi:hypothetical protein
MRVAAVLAASLTLAAAASVTACSAGSKSAADTSAPASASAASASATSASAAGAAAASTAAAGNSGSSGTVKSLDVCTALTAAQASQIVGTTFATTKANSVDNQIFGCDYSTGDSALLQVSVEMTNGKSVYGSQVDALKTVGSPPVAEKGVGDEAFYESADTPGASIVATYGAVFGDVFIKIGGLTPVTAAQGKQIVEELHSKL